MVQNLLRMKAALDEIWEKAFQRNETYGHALKEAFEHFINQRANKPAELIAKFLDQLLRSGSKGKSEEDLDANLERALLLFRYISVRLLGHTALPPLPKLSDPRSARRFRILDAGVPLLFKHILLGPTDNPPHLSLPPYPSGTSKLGNFR